MAKLNRAPIVHIHLAFAAVFLPFLLIMPLTGGLHMLGWDGEPVKTTAFEIATTIPEDKAEQDRFFRDEFKKQGIEFDWETIKSNGKDFTFRPTSRDYYQASKTESGATVYFVKMPLARKLLEIHMGHGPKLIKWLEIAFAVALLLTTITGLYLAITSRMYRKTLIVSFTVGAVLIALATL